MFCLYGRHEMRKENFYPGLNLILRLGTLHEDSHLEVLDIMGSAPVSHLEVDWVSGIQSVHGPIGLVHSAVPGARLCILSLSAQSVCTR